MAARSDQLLTGLNGLPTTQEPEAVVAKSGPSPLLTLASLLLFLVGEIGGWLHRVMFRPTPHTCLENGGKSDPPACIHCGKSIYGWRHDTAEPEAS